MADMMDKTINSILTALIAVVLIASAFIPVVIKQISALSSLVDPSGNMPMYTTLISVVVIMTIIGIIIGVIKSYSSNDNGDGFNNEGKR